MKMLGVAATAARLGLHINTVKRLPVDELPYIRVSTRGDRRYREEDIDQYMVRHRGPAYGPTPLVQQYLDRYDGSVIYAAGAMARDLMRGDEATPLKQGFTLGNALLAVTRLFGLTIIEQALVADEAVK